MRTRRPPTDSRRRFSPSRIFTLHRDERAVVTLEFMLNAFIIFAFMMLADSQRVVLSTENVAYAEAHRRLFTQTSTFLDTQFFIDVDLGPFTPAPGSLGGDFFTSAQAAELELDDPQVDDEDLAALPGVVDTNRGLARGIGSSFSQYWIGPRLVGDGVQQDPDYELHREGYTIRPPWTWGMYPGVFTQSQPEQSNVHDWYETVRDKDYSDWAETLKLRGDF